MPPSGPWRPSASRLVLSSTGGSGKAAAQQRPLPAPPSVPAPADSRVAFHPDDTTPIPRPSRYYGRRQNELAEHFRAERRQAERAMGMLPIHAPMAPSQSAPPLAPDAQPDPLPGRIDKSLLTIAEPKRLCDKAHFRFVALKATYSHTQIPTPSQVTITQLQFPVLIPPSPAESRR